MSQGRPENEGLVLSKFILDVEEQIRKFVYDDVYVLISGDLVFAASDESYAKFDDIIVKELMRVLNIDRNHFIIAPGNHDISQSAVKDVEDSFLPIFRSNYDESKFNDLVRKPAQDTIILGKFDAFKRYMKNTMEAADYSLLVNRYDINDIWSVHVLNTAILSCGAYKGIDDRGHMAVDTRGLHEIINHDKHPKKILMVHHPEEFCMDWVKHELRKLFGQEYSIILSGHTHDQYMYCDEKNEYVRCEAPQLFTDKYDPILGYNFIELDDDQVIKITYRQWQEKRNKFRAGSDFLEDEESNGVVSFAQKSNDGNKSEPVLDRVSFLLQERLRKEMVSYVGQPYIWLDRYLSDDRLDNVFKMYESTLYSEIDIIKKGENIRVVAPSQYGVTCYGSHFLITLWESRKEFGIKVDADGVRLKKFEKLVEEELAHYEKDKIDVKWIVIDNWKPYRRDQKGIKSYLEQEFPDAHLLLMTIFHESEFVEGRSFDEEEIKSKTLYLTPIKRAQERMMVDAYNKEKFIDDSDEILNKLDEDIKNFNLHRSPHSCATLLTVFRDSFDKNPVNRTEVLENILSIIFDNTRLPHYKSKKPDAKDCDFCLGFFCAKLLKTNDCYFTRENFVGEIRGFCRNMEYDVDVDYLFDILCYNKIIVADLKMYKFHFTFWVYYFVASWMIANEDYANEMLEKQNYLHFPEVLEFYTGKDRRRRNAVETLIMDLSLASKSIQEKIGIKEQDDPFAFLRFNQSKQQEDIIIERIESLVNQSNLPQSVKDHAADLSFNPSAAFHQDIFKVYSDFSVGYLVNMIRIGCKVLRNSDQLDSEVKQHLLSELTSAMKILSNIIYLVSPLFSKQGYIQLTDYPLKLTESFFKLDEKERTIRILVAIPYNLTMMFKEDIFSSKLSSVFVSALNNEKDKVKRHLLASLLVYKQPDGWGNAINTYMGTIGQNSYYIGTLLELMLGVYQNGDLDESELMRLKNLIRAAIFKNSNGRLPISQGEYKHIGVPRVSIEQEKEEEKSFGTGE